MINFNIYFNHFNHFNIPNNSNNSNNDISYNVYDWSELNDKYYLANLVFAKNNTSNTNNNIWSNIKFRPFKICPCKYDELVVWTNDSIINIIVRNETNKIIGFCVVSDMIEYYFINILCTNINQGIGTMILNFIKSVIGCDKPIKLKSTFNSENFYLKKGFVKINNNMLKYSNKKIDL